jgi:hypothetical protein
MCLGKYEGLCWNLETTSREFGDKLRVPLRTYAIHVMDNKCSCSVALFGKGRRANKRRHAIQLDRALQSTTSQDLGLYTPQ